MNQQNEFMLQECLALHVQSASIPAVLTKLENKAPRLLALPGSSGACKDLHPL